VPLYNDGEMGELWIFFSEGERGGQGDSIGDRQREKWAVKRFFFSLVEEGEGESGGFSKRSRRAHLPNISRRGNDVIIKTLIGGEGGEVVRYDVASSR